jgi:aldehyde:ferredoxin oxidoreductase
MPNFKYTILRIDLTRRKIREESIPPFLIDKFLGGRGLGAKILFDELAPHSEPLSPDNKLLFLTGPLIGTGAPWCVKYTVVTKSPLSETILMSLAGGFFGPHLRFAGYDGLLIEGRSDEPTFLWIDNGRVEFRTAIHLWGLNTDECQDTIRKELNQPSIEMACIGPAGEKSVRFACIISGWRAAGRGGAGAVMGVKNLKAIAVKGSRKVPISDTETFNKIQKAIRKKVPKVDRLKIFGKYGTPKNLVLVNERGLFPTRNFQLGTFEGIDRVNATEQQKRVIGSVTCHKCPVACGNLTCAAEGPYQGITTEGPEYETFWAFGALCGNSSIDAIVAADRLCDQLGLDTISTGSAIAFAMECAEKGLLEPHQLDGLDLRFGNHSAMLEMIHRIGSRQGVGALLAEGVRRAAEQIGKNSERFAMHVKGLELAAYDPRGAKSMGIGYATSPRGGCHERGLISRETFGAPPFIDPLATEGKGKVVKESQDETAVLDSLGVCVFPPHNDGMQMEDIAQLFSCVIGKSITAAELMDAGNRIWNLERLFNIREGFSRKDDRLPPRLLNEPMPEGPAEGQVVELDILLDDYYRTRQWNDNGIPTSDILSKLGLIEEGKSILHHGKGNR